MGTVLEWRWREREREIEREKEFLKETRWMDVNCWFGWTKRKSMFLLAVNVFLFSFSVETFLTVVIQWDSGVFGYRLVKDQGVTVGRNRIRPICPTRLCSLQ
jgi:hypothetical protein